MTERIQLFDDLGAEIGRVAAEAERTSRKPVGRLFRSGLRPRTLAIALGIAVLLVSGAFALPATRTTVGGIADSFSAWVSGDDGAAPGRALEPGDDVPSSWLSGEGDTRLIAKTEGVGLYVRRKESDHGPWLEFGLGEGVFVSMGAPLTAWRQMLNRHAVVVLGTATAGPRDALDDRGRSPLLGLTDPDVERVELRYSEGPPLVNSTGDGGFVLLVDAGRPLRELIAYDDRGRVLERVDMGDNDLTYLCEKEPNVCSHQVADWRSPSLRRRRSPQGARP